MAARDVASCQCKGWKEDKVELDKNAVLYIHPRLLSQSVALRMIIVKFSVIPPEGVSPILSCSLRLILTGTGFFGLDAIDGDAAPVASRALTNTYLAISESGEVRSTRSIYI
jgi:hypothetical protein